MWKDNLVSIIMPAYNAKNNIEASIQSVLSQTYKDWELIIIDDGSTDGTYEYLLRNYAENEKIKVYSMKQNGGVASARNNGIKQAKGEFLAFLDSDDTWKSEKLEKQVAFMKEKDCHFTYTSYDIRNSGESLKTYQVPSKLDFKDQLKGSKIGTLTVMLDRKKISCFYMRNIGHEDYVAWMELLKNYGPAYGLQESLAIYNNRDSGISSNKFKAAKWQYDIYRNILNFSVPKSIYYFIFYIMNGFKKHLR